MRLSLVSTNAWLGGNPFQNRAAATAKGRVAVQHHQLEGRKPWTTLQPLLEPSLFRTITEIDGVAALPNVTLP